MQRATCQNMASTPKAGSIRQWLRDAGIGLPVGRDVFPAGRGLIDDLHGRVGGTVVDEDVFALEATALRPELSADIGQPRRLVVDRHDEADAGFRAALHFSDPASGSPAPVQLARLARKMPVAGITGRMPAWRWLPVRRP